MRQSCRGGFETRPYKLDTPLQQEKRDEDQGVKPRGCPQRVAEAPALAGADERQFQHLGRELVLERKLLQLLGKSSADRHWIGKEKETPYPFVLDQILQRTDGP